MKKSKSSMMKQISKKVTAVGLMMVLGGGPMQTSAMTTLEQLQHDRKIVETVLWPKLQPYLNETNAWKGFKALFDAAPKLSPRVKALHAEHLKDLEYIACRELEGENWKTAGCDLGKSGLNESEQSEVYDTSLFTGRRGDFGFESWDSGFQAGKAFDELWDTATRYCRKEALLKAVANTLQLPSGREQDAGCASFDGFKKAYKDIAVADWCKINWLRFMYDRMSHKEGEKQ